MPKSIGGVPVDEGRKCEARNSRGGMCKNPAAVGSHFCPYHEDPDNPKPMISPKWAGAARAYKSGALDQMWKR